MAFRRAKWQAMSRYALFRKRVILRRPSKCVAGKKPDLSTSDVAEESRVR